MEQNRFLEKLKNGEMPVAVELDPPVGADLTKYFEGARELTDGGCDIITMADCPSGRARMDASVAAAVVTGKLGVEVIPHMTCRDRNLNAVKGTIFGLYAANIRNMLLVTGDPLPKEDIEGTKPVFQFGSNGLLAYAKKTLDDAGVSMGLFGALNVNAANFDVELSKIKEKTENGAIGFFTQPVLTEAALENLKKARQATDAYIMGGIIPITSEKNAIFMNENIPGIKVEPKLIAMYAGKDKDECESISVEVSAEIGTRIKPYIDGYYLITPFSRTTLMSRIMERLK